MGILPHEDVAEGEAPVLGSFLSFVEKLFSFAASLEETRDLAGWASHLGAALDTFFLADGDEEEDLHALRRALTDLALLQSQSGLDERLGAGVLKAHLEEALREVGLGFGFITGGITFCAFASHAEHPLSGDLPHRPRRRRLPAADPGAGIRSDEGAPQARRSGSRRLDDRYLFLEALLSARQTFYISYAGQSIQDNSVRPPSVLVSELLDAIKQGFETPGRDIGDAIVTQHRLQAFSPGTSAGRGFQLPAENAAAALSGRCRPQGETALHFLSPPRAAACVAKHRRAGPRPVLRQPGPLAAQPQAGIRLEEAGAFLDDVEPMSLEGLGATNWASCSRRDASKGSRRGICCPPRGPWEACRRELRGSAGSRRSARASKPSQPA